MTLHVAPWKYLSHLAKKGLDILFPDQFCMNRSNKSKKGFFKMCVNHQMPLCLYSLNNVAVDQCYVSASVDLESLFTVSIDLICE